MHELSQLSSRIKIKKDKLIGFLSSGILLKALNGLKKGQISEARQRFLEELMPEIIIAAKRGCIAQAVAEADDAKGELEEHEGHP